MAKRKTRSLNIPAKYPDRADRMILGDGCIFSTDCRKTGLNNNILVVGGSGSGKTVSIVEPFLLESFSRSIVCSVTKRGIVNKFIPLLQNRGYKILDLDFVHPSRGNVCFDPLDYINSFADISFLSQSIISGTRRNALPVENKKRRPCPERYCEPYKHYENRPEGPSGLVRFLGS